MIKVAAFNNKTDFKNKTGYSNKYGAEPKLMTVRQLQYIESLLKNRAVDDNCREDVSRALKGSLTHYEASKIIDELLNIVLPKNGPQEGSDRNKSDTKVGTLDSGNPWGQISTFYMLHASPTSFSSD